VPARKKSKRTQDIIACQHQLPAWKIELKSEICDIKAAQSKFEETITDTLHRQLQGGQVNYSANGKGSLWGQKRAACDTMRHGSDSMQQLGESTWPKCWMSWVREAAGGSRSMNETRRWRECRDQCHRGEATKVRQTHVLDSVPPTVWGCSWSQQSGSTGDHASTHTLQRQVTNILHNVSMSQTEHMRILLGQ
jgi:hypothetical protein